MITALGFCSMTSSIESLERLERAYGLVTSLSVDVFPGALQTEQKIGGWREGSGERDEFDRHLGLS